MWHNGFVKKELLIHFSFLISFFIFVSLVRSWLSLSYWQFWVGGLIGTLLPDLDHLLYVYFLKPQDLTSQRAAYMMGKKEFIKTVELLSETRYERTRLIFHTALFQIIFLIFSFLVITSSGSMLGRGIVLAFMLHLVVDEIVDLMEIGNLSNWFRQTKIVLDKQQATWYWLGNLLGLFLFGFLL